MQVTLFDFGNNVGADRIQVQVKMMDFIAGYQVNLSKFQPSRPYILKQLPQKAVFIIMITEKSLISCSLEDSWLYEKLMLDNLMQSSITHFLI